MRVSDFIPKNEYSTWNPGDVIIIDAPTGAGKTYFVLNELVKNAASQGKDVVFLCNRISIKSQLINNIFRAAEKEGKPIPENLYILSYQKCEKIGNFNSSEIRINRLDLSEEELKFYKHKKGSTITINPQNVMYYLFDEPQHLIQGASYDTEAQFWDLKKFLNNKSVFVFTTATPEPLYLYFYYHYAEKHGLKLERFLEARRKYNEIQNLITQVDPVYQMNHDRLKEQYENELKKWTIKSVWKDIISEIDEVFSNSFTFKINGHKLIVYRISREFKNYSCSYFYDFSDLVDTIIDSKEKWLVFINDENEGASFKERLNATYQLKFQKTDDIAVLLSVRTRNKKTGSAYKEYLNITQHEFFSCKVLIATSIIDCGVNIKDEKVNNIVISQTDKTTFLQMLGRRRIQCDETINLFLKVFTPSQINSLSKINQKKIEQVVDFLSLDTATYYSKLYGKTDFKVERQRRSLENDISNRCLADLLSVKLPKYNEIKPNNFDVKDVVKINYNKLIHCYYLVYLYYGSILKNAGNHAYHYLNTQLSWLDDKYNQKAWIISKHLREEIEHFLNDNLGVISSKDIENFKIELLKKLLKIPFIAFPSAMHKVLSRYQKIISGEKDGPLPTRERINMILSGFNFNYEIDNKYTYSQRKKETNWKLKQLPSKK